jgi:hypothetical protein
MNRFAATTIVLGVTAWATGCNTPSSQPATTTSSQALAPSASAQAAPSASTLGMAPGDRRRAMMGGLCPVEVAGTTVSAQDSQGGATLVFGTTGDVLQVRERVRAMADMHNRRQGGGHPGMGDAGMHGRFGPPDGGMRMPWPDGGMRMPWPDGGMMHGGMMMGPPSEARAEDLERGAQLVLTAVKASDTDALRAHARQMAERMGQGHCFMGPPGESAAGGGAPPPKP